MKIPRVSKNILRARGYMTTDEFIETLIPGLKQYMANNWHWAGKDALHHPVDLASNLTIYAESLYNIIETFGVQPYEKKGVPWT